MGKYINLQEAEKKLVKKKSAETGVRILSEQKLGGIPEDLALWLFWRKTIKEERVPAKLVQKLVGKKVTAAMVNNFFSNWYGIGESDSFALPIKRFSDLYLFFNTKRKRDNQRVEKMDEPSKKKRGDVRMPNFDSLRVVYPGDEKVEEYIDYWEEEYLKRLKDLKGSSDK